MDTLDGHEDMHAGELETSLLLYAAPGLVRDSYRTADVDDQGHPHFLTTGLRAYTSTDVAGRPSAATADKGGKALDALTARAAEHLQVLRQEP